MSKKDEPMTVCIVGVAGFIGSHLLEKIIRERTWNVLGCDMVSPLKIQQLLADTLQMPVERPADTESTALGAALLAGLGAGVWQNETDLETCWRSD